MVQSRGKQSKKAQIKVGMLGNDPLRFIGLKAILESQPGLEILPVSGSDLASAVESDVLLIPEQNGRDLVEVIDALKATRPDIRILITGQHPQDEAYVQAILGGAKGYIDESAPASDFAHAIRVVSDGLHWAPRRIVSLLHDKAVSADNHRFSRDSLTAREREVLQMLVAGRSNKEIASPLGIEERTVKAHVAKLMRKTGTANRIALSIHAITHLLVNVAVEA